MIAARQREKNHNCYKWYILVILYVVRFGFMAF